MQPPTEIEDEDINLRLIRLYILHRAAIEPIDSRRIVEKLDRHGLKLPTGSVSQIFRRLEGKGYLVSDGGPSRKTYRLTNRGRLTIKQAGSKIRELCGSS